MILQKFSNFFFFFFLRAGVPPLLWKKKKKKKKRTGQIDVNKCKAPRQRTTSQGQLMIAMLPRPGLFLGRCTSYSVRQISVRFHLTKYIQYSEFLQSNV